MDRTTGWPSRQSAWEANQWKAVPNLEDGIVKDRPNQKQATDSVCYPVGTTTLDAAERSVDAVEFLELALSNRKLWRHDDTQRGRRGLLDPHTGERILTPDSQLAELASQGEDS